MRGGGDEMAVRPVGSASGAFSVVVILDGHHPNVVDNARADAALELAGAPSAQWQVSSPYEVTFERFDSSGFAVRVELTPADQTRLQVLHVAPDDTASILRLSEIMRRIVAGSLPKVSATGVNFSRVYLDGTGFAPKKFLRELGSESGLAGILGGAGQHSIVEATLMRDVRGDRVGQLKLRAFIGEAVTGRITGMHADVNFTTQTPTKREVRSAITRNALLKRIDEFDRIISRLERKMRK